MPIYILYSWSVITANTFTLTAYSWLRSTPPTLIDVLMFSSLFIHNKNVCDLKTVWARVLNDGTTVWAINGSTMMRPTGIVNQFNSTVAFPIRCMYLIFLRWCFDELCYRRLTYGCGPCHKERSSCSDPLSSMKTKGQTSGRAAGVPDRLFPCLYAPFVRL